MGPAYLVAISKDTSVFGLLVMLPSNWRWYLACNCDFQYGKYNTCVMMYMYFVVNNFVMW